ncbi:MAG TPA: hypothetical protein VKQ36_12180 [Ktedonobacterales bacterium]|nr:hypothetical protein [Ktedonobacterales bacterium]
MKQALSASGAIARRRTDQSPTRCSICTHRLGKTLFQIDDTLDLGTSDSSGAPADDAPFAAAFRRQSWFLCKECYMDVEREVRRAELQTPFRVRVAIGLVASERSPQLRPRIWEGRYWNNDKHVEAWLWWMIIVVAFGHMVVFIIIMLWPAIVQYLTSF